MKVSINKCHGGYCFSDEATLELLKRGSPVVKLTPYDKYYGSTFEAMISEKEKADKIAKDKAMWSRMNHGVVYTDDGVVSSADRYDSGSRHDPILIALIEEWGGKRVSGKCADIQIVEIPDGIKYEIEEYDGREHIAEAHSTWY